MILPYIAALSKKKIILGSQSKTRNQLMKAQQLPYERIPSTFEENLDKKSFPNASAYNQETCRGKANELLSRFKKENIQWDALICGDTIVQHKGKIIEKPQNAQHCIQMMSQLSGDTHKILTAHTIVFNSEPLIRYEWITNAQVTFGVIPKESLEAFSKTDQPYIHSGGYELTAASGSFIKEIKGSHTCIQGLDVYEVCNKLIEGGKTLKWF